MFDYYLFFDKPCLKILKIFSKYYWKLLAFFYRLGILNNRLFMEYDNVFIVMTYDFWTIFQ